MGYVDYYVCVFCIYHNIIFMYQPLVNYDCGYYAFINFFIGRQFFTVEEMLFSAHHASYKECLDAGIHCFLMAIDVRLYTLCVYMHAYLYTYTVCTVYAV